MHAGRSAIHGTAVTAAFKLRLRRRRLVCTTAAGLPTLSVRKAFNSPPPGRHRVRASVHFPPTQAVRCHSQPPPAGHDYISQNVVRLAPAVPVRPVLRPRLLASLPCETPLLHGSGATYASDVRVCWLGCHRRQTGCLPHALPPQPVRLRHCAHAALGHAGGAADGPVVPRTKPQRGLVLRRPRARLRRCARWPVRYMVTSSLCTPP